MKLSVSTYSFMQYIKSGKLTIFECIEKTKEMGFASIEFSIHAFIDVEDKQNHARALKAKCDEVGLVVSNYSTSAELVNNDYDDEVAKLKEEVDIAEILGSKCMRHDVTAGPNPRLWKGYDNVIDLIAKACKEVTAYAKTKGIRTTTENHGYFSQDSLRVEKLVNTVADENFGLLVDIGNFMCADDAPGVAVGRCAPYAFHVHAKDFIVKSGNETNPGNDFFLSRGGNFLRGTIIGHGDVPVLQCLRALDRIGYDGYVSIEFEGPEDCIAGITIGKENLEKYISLL